VKCQIFQLRHIPWSGKFTGKGSNGVFIHEDGTGGYYLDFGWEDNEEEKGRFLRNMDIQSLGILKDATIQGNTTTVKNAESNFRQLFEKTTGGELAREIRDNYDVTLNVGNVVNCDQFLETNDLRGTNHVIISSAALSKMENNSVLKEKVLNDIEEFCSPENQAAIRALQPPVKSAGMIGWKLPAMRCSHIHIRQWAVWQSKNCTGS